MEISQDEGVKVKTPFWLNGIGVTFLMYISIIEGNTKQCSGLGSPSIRVVHRYCISQCEWNGSENSSMKHLNRKGE